jgi:hypothetical protein
VKVLGVFGIRRKKKPKSTTPGPLGSGIWITSTQDHDDDLADDVDQGSAEL